MKKFLITASVVLYKSESSLVNKLIQSLSACVLDRVVVIDNSPTEQIYNFEWPLNFLYFKSDRNIGFGAGHNKAFSLLDVKSDFHFFLNPDVFFNEDLATSMANILYTDPKIAVLAPRILYPDGREQPSTRLLPAPLNLIVRRFFPNINLKKHLLRNYEMHFLDRGKRQDVPIVSGCCFMMRSSIFKILNGFDTRFFLYNEDYDLVRRAGTIGKIVYSPEFIVYHDYKKESSKSLKVFIYHVISTIRYFNKWGWFSDGDRDHINFQFLNK
jgi:GT2 family glycosyltransferase